MTDRCLVCGTPVITFHVGSASVGGRKSATLEESVAAPQFAHDLQFCPSCTFTHYDENPAATEVLDDYYRSHHATYSLLSPANAHLKFLASTVCDCAPDDGLILEIGCNDGTLLEEFKKGHGRDVLGIEPSRGFFDLWERRGVEVINDFFSEATVSKLADKNIAAVVIRHALEHIADPVAFLKAVTRVMGENTVLVIESPYLPTVLERGRFESIGIAHLNHFTTRAIDQICAPLGMGIEKFQRVDTDGGSFVAILRKGQVTPEDLIDSVTQDDVQDFIDRMAKNGDRLRRVLGDYESGAVVGYGAGAKGPFLLSLYDLGPMLPAVIDDNPSFHGQYLDGVGTKVVPSSVLEDDTVKAVLILAPTHSDRIEESLPPGKTVINVI